MQVGFATHVGQRHQNQDNGLVDDDLKVYAVADGVGGGDSGEIASASVCHSIRQAMVRGHKLPQAIHLAHDVLLGDDLAKERGYAASTIAAIQVNSNDVQIAWVGDSRIYLMRGGRLQQVSRDHSVIQQVNGLSAEEAARIRHVLTQAVGAAGEQGLIVDDSRVERKAGDIWLVCSDGLYGVVDELNMLAILQNNKTSQEQANQLTELALNSGADDNTTVVVFHDETGCSNPNIENNSEDRKLKLVSNSAVNESASTMDSKEPLVQTRPWQFILLGSVLALIIFLIFLN